MSGQNRINNSEFRAGAPQKGRIVVTFDERTGQYGYEKVYTSAGRVYQDPAIPEVTSSVAGEEQQVLGNVDVPDAWQEDYPSELVLPERKSKKRLRSQRFGQAIMLSVAITGSYVAVDTATTLGHSGKAPNVIEDALQLPGQIGKTGESVVDFVGSVGRMLDGMPSFSNIGDK